MPKRMTERYDVEARRMRPDDEWAKEIIGLVDRLSPGGSVYHCLAHTPEQYEDLLVILVDDRAVVRFELPRGAGARLPAEIHVWSLEDYRREVGQGRHRIFVDLAAGHAREVIAGKRA